MTKTNWLPSQKVKHAFAELSARAETGITMRGYSINKTIENEAAIALIKHELNVKPVVNPKTPGANAVQPFPVYRESASKLYIPAWYGLQLCGAPQVDKLSRNGDPAPRLQFQGDLRSEQLGPVNAFMTAARDPCRRGGILELRCGAGKTVLALYIAAQLKKKTLIICHAEFLMNQWRERIAQFLPDAKVGLIKQSKVDVEDRDIVIASLQSLAMREYDSDVFKAFGLMVIDECHHCAAEVFSRALFKIHCPVTLGLSATIDRKDGLTKVFIWHTGDPVFTLRKRDDPDVVVWDMRYYHQDPQYGVVDTLYNGSPNTVAMITRLVEFAPRNEMIVRCIRRLKALNPSRKILVLGERIAHLRALHEMLEPHRLGKLGFYIGGMKEHQLKASEDSDILLASLRMAKEGMDIKALDTLVLVSPCSDIEQPVGRILRLKPEERVNVPMVVDITDDFSVFKSQGAKRLKHYKREHYTIRRITKAEDITDKASEGNEESSGDEDDDEVEAKTEESCMIKL